MNRRRTAVVIAIAVVLAAAIAVWVGSGVLWRFFLALHGR